MSVCQACGGLIGRDCFNPEECMQITRDQAALCRELPGSFVELQIENDDLRAKVKSLRETVEHLESRIVAMNGVLGEVRMAVGGNQYNQHHPEDFDPECPWLPVGLMYRIDEVMTREYRE